MTTDLLNDLLDREYFGMKLGLENIQAMLERLDNPQDSFRSIHVAGTNGKGSTSTMIARILEAGHYKVGLYTSPHLQHLSERFQINGHKISRQRLTALAERINAVNTGKSHLSFFEFMTVIAFLYFAEESVDVAVIEVGMGGRLDATNVLSPDVSVITEIAYDHQEHLGKRLQQIAQEKAGIIKEQTPLVSGVTNVKLRKFLQRKADALGAPTLFVNEPTLHRDGSFSWGGLHKMWIPTLGHGQVLNACVAVAAVQAFEDSEQSVLPPTVYHRGLASAVIPGRMEFVRRSPFIVLDGAHNPAAIQHLVETCQEIFKKRRIHCLFAAMADKDIAMMLSHLRPLTNEIHVTETQMKRTASQGAITKKAELHGFRVKGYPNCQAALRHLSKKLLPDEALLVTGSLFLVGEARSYLNSRAAVAA